MEPVVETLESAAQAASTETGGALRKGKGRRWLRFALFGILLISVVAYAAYRRYSPQLPPPTGPYAVGRTSYLWSDASREEVWTDDPSDHRELMAYVWYPATKGKTSPAAYYPPLDKLSGQFDSMHRFVLGKVESYSLSDAPLASGKGPYPVLLFSPGANNSVLFYASLLEDLAGHGYIVVGMEHTYEGRGQVFPDGRVISPTAEKKHPDPKSPTFEADIENFYRKRVDIRAKDAVFVLSQLDDLNSKDARFSGRLDMSRVGILGHSVGGVAAPQAARLSPRIQASVNIDGRMKSMPMFPDAENHGPKQAFLFIAKALKPYTDEELKRQNMTREALDASRAKFEAKEDALLSSIKSGSYRVTIPEAAHDSFTDETYLVPGGYERKLKITQVTRDTLLAFFGSVFDGKPMLNGSPAGPPEVKFSRFQPK
jgi:predicted dienelactone hydrolase